jgi:hypothetical protein
MHTRVRGVETRPIIPLPAHPLSPSSALLLYLHLQVRCLEESSSCLVDALQPRLLELLRHLSYGVRFEAAVTLQVHTCPYYSYIYYTTSLLDLLPSYICIII